MKKAPILTVTVFYKYKKIKILCIIAHPQKANIKKMVSIFSKMMNI